MTETCERCIELLKQIDQLVKTNDAHVEEIHELKDSLEDSEDDLSREEAEVRDLKCDIDDLSRRLSDAEDAEIIPDSATEMAQILNDWVRGAEQSQISELSDELNRLLNAADLRRLLYAFVCHGEPPGMTPPKGSL